MRIGSKSNEVNQKNYNASKNVCFAKQVSSKGST